MNTGRSITRLHRKYSPSDRVYDLVHTHSKIVHDIAMQLIASSGFALDADLVKTGTMLHDIGAYPLFGSDDRLREGVDYITHGVEGEAILRREGFPRKVCRMASHHTGVGIPKEEVKQQNIPLPLDDYLAETDEELIIMYADKFHSKTTPPYFNSFEWYKKYVSRFGDDKVEKFEEMRRKFGLPDLVILSRKYGHEIR